MDFTIKIEIKRPDWCLTPGHKTLFLGSCFATHIGERLVENAFHARVNPFGVLYNPESIRLALRALMRGEVEESAFFEERGMWHSWMHDTTFSAPDLDACRERVETAFRPTVELVRELDVLAVTFGTNRYYRLCDGGMVVSNCHKVPQSAFREESLSVQEMVERWTVLLEELLAARPGLRVIFTVSPYRYAKYGYHESTLSKAVLHLAVDELVHRFPENVSYFPAYELLLDELRDYRFYKEDMLHPSDQAVEYIWERFLETYADTVTQDFVWEFAPIRNALRHRPLHPESKEYAAFITKNSQKVMELSRKYPNFAAKSVIKALESLKEP